MRGKDTKVIIQTNDSNIMQTLIFSTDSKGFQQVHNSI